MKGTEGSTAVVGQYLYRGDAEVARALLASQGIESYVKAEDEGGLNPGFFSEYRVVLVVDSAQVGEARAVLGLGESLFVPAEVKPPCWRTVRGRRRVRAADCWRARTMQSRWCSA